MTEQAILNLLQDVDNYKALVDLYASIIVILVLATPFIYLWMSAKLRHRYMCQAMAPAAAAECETSQRYAPEFDTAFQDYPFEESIMVTTRLFAGIQSDSEPVHQAMEKYSEEPPQFDWEGWYRDNPGVDQPRAGLDYNLEQMPLPIYPN